jgi:hypothetical protein
VAHGTRTETVKVKKKKKQTNEDMRLALETTTNGEKKIVWGILFLFSIVSFFTSTH